MNDQPLVSIIIPTYNRKTLLEEAIKSVVTQSFKAWEIIIVDDHSNPAVNHDDIRSKFGKDIIIQTHPNSLGGAAAKNAGASIAKGKYIAFLDDDDLYAPTYLEKAIATLERNERIKTLFMNVKWFGANETWAQNDHDRAMNKMLAQAQGIHVDDSVIFFEKRPLFKALLNSVPMAFQRPVLRRQHFLDVGYYKPDCLLWDCDWAIRASLHGNCALLTDELYLQRCAGQGYSSTPRRLIEHQLSNFTLKQQLFKQNKDPDLGKLIKESIIRAGQALCWGYMQEKQHLQACKSIMKTFEYGITYSQLKFFVHNIANALKIRLQNILN